MQEAYRKTYQFRSKMNNNKNHIIHKITLLLGGILLLSSCAQIVSPGGGAKDILPPKTSKYIPDSAQLNFNSRIIEITFDEYIQLKDLNNQLIISPMFSKTPEIAVKGKTLSIELDNNETLQPNTTYCISFGNSVQDLNENNGIENFKYIFSTGTFIDSLTLKGKVQNGFSQYTEKGILAILYSDLSDSVVYKSQPDYFSKTEKDGTFQINNIKAGKYKLAAFKDGNSNFKYDGESESIGFIDATIDISEKQNILIDLFQEPAKKVYLKKYIHDSYGKVTLIFNQGSDSIRVEALNNDQKGLQEFLMFSKNNDTLVYWMKNFLKDSLILQVSNGNKILDTVELKLISRVEAEKSKKNPLKLNIVSSPNINQPFDLGSEIKIQFSTLIGEIQIEKIEFKEDTLLFKSDKRIANNYELLNNYIVLKNFILKENTSYHLFIPPGAITDIFGSTNDSIKIDFKTREEKFYGSVKLNLVVPAPKGEYIIQLLDEGNNIVRENFVASSSELNYTYLAPRKYKLKIVVDDNRNHRWDTGNYLKKNQPEKVIYNSELINIRSNWDAELDWKISE